MSTSQLHNHVDIQPELRLFLSSTFIDLQPEREQLIKKIFPQIRALCRERGVEFTEIDLRWGITDEEARSGKVIRICLEEIDKCRPYFLGLMGSRYGWRPKIEDIEKDPDLLNIYPWLRKFASENKSITELEYTYGALQSENETSALFYEQNCDEKISDEDRPPYTKLKNTLRSAGLLFNTFDTPEELGEQVLRDLTAILERDFPVRKELTPAERERAAHEAFAHNRTHSYIANPEYYERFEKFVESNDAPLILWGKSGFGKSALMAHLTSEYRHHHPNAFIIRHFVGATAGASSADDVMRHIMLEIKERYELADELPQSNVQEEFPVWLAKIKEDEKLILAIDAVNQLTGIGNEMHWLPEFIPANVRLIISTTPELPLEQLRKRNWQELEIEPLSANQRKRITQEFLAHYHKHLQPELLEQIALEEKLESPLFLRTVLEELRIFGRHETVGKHLASYLASENEAALFQNVLARMERDHGEETVRAVMMAIWASRFGFSESELLGITGLTRLNLSEFLIALEFHLMQRTGLFTFFHNYLREAVEIRYLHDEIAKKEMHRHLASYFSAEPYDERRRNEEPWQWQMAEDVVRFKECISDTAMMDMLLDDSRMQELLGYWLYLQKSYDLAETYHAAMTNYRKECTDDHAFAELSAKLGNALVAASSYKEAEFNLENAIAIRRNSLGEDHLETAESMNDLAGLYYYTAEFLKAEDLLKSVISIREKALPKNDPLVAKAWNDIGAIIYSQGKLDEATSCYGNALHIYEFHEDKFLSEIADSYCNLGSVYYFKKEYKRAIDFFERSIGSYEKRFGKRNAKIIPPLSNLAMAYMEIQNNEKAEQHFMRTLSLTKSMYGNLHDSVRIIYLNLGVFYFRKGEFEKSLIMNKDALEVSQRLLGEEHYLTINSYLSIGSTLYCMGKLTEGREFIEKYLPIQKEKIGSTHQLYKLQEERWNELQKSQYLFLKRVDFCK